MEIQEIKKIISEVKHPEINKTLTELGMIGDINQEGNKITVTIKIPVPGIPIIDMLKESIEQALKTGIEIKTDLMNDTEKENFLKLARENWAL